MHNSKSVPISGDGGILNTVRLRRMIVVSICIGIILMIVVFSLSIATLAKLNDRPEPHPDDHSTTTESPTTAPNNPSLVASIRVDDAMSHLNAFQRIANGSGNTRAVSAPGFNETLNYIINYLTVNTNYKITREYFPVNDFALASDPILISSIDGATTNYTYSANLDVAQFTFVRYSGAAAMNDLVPLTAVKNFGCSDDDWLGITPAPENHVVLIKRGECTIREKGALAAKYNVSAVLFYNDGTSPERFPPIATSLVENNTVPALFLSYIVGLSLSEALKDPAKNTAVRLTIETQDLPPVSVGNICADTPTGDVTQTIVIGSHSDSVPAGPGINDNGSGSAANLALAVALARLFRTTTYPKYKYRVRFCWWGAEELGLLGSAYHVKQANQSTVEGERLQDYLINLNYDMLGSPNYIFGIYDGRTARNDTPSQALNGSNKITNLFRSWFDKENLPWDYTDFSGRSDYGPFLAAGIVAGGLFSGADEKKTHEQRDRYDQMLGQGMGGIPDILTDPCYHKACDSIQNINVFCYEKMIKAAAYVLEYLGREEDLKTWLYPHNATDFLHETWD